MSEIVNVTPAAPVFDPVALMTMLSQMQVQLKAAEDRAIAAERKAEAAKTGEEILNPGVHPLGFDCMIAPDKPGDIDSPFREFEIASPIVVFTGLQKVTIGKTPVTMGPTISYFGAGRHSWSPAKCRRSYDAYISVNAGASSTKLTSPAEDWMEKSSIGVHWKLLRDLVFLGTQPELWYRGKRVDNLKNFVAAVEEDCLDWFRDLGKAESKPKTRYERGKR